MMSRINYAIFVLLFCLLSAWLSSCNKTTAVVPLLSVDTLSKPLSMKGSGSLIFTAYSPLANKPVQVFYHIPSTANNFSPVLMVFHGADRNASYSRDELISSSDKLGFIVIAPEFSDTYYPNADQYQMGNLFVDGDNPTANTLNDEKYWTFSVIDTVFYFMKNKMGSSIVNYDVFGHSAGGQFAHRFLLFKPNAKINRLVTASSGWYTMYDNKINFPYGTKLSPAEFASYNNLFNKKVFVLVGDLDTDPNSFDLRHNEIVDKQGLNRLERAQYFYVKSREEAEKRNSAFNWKYYSLKGVGHDFSKTSAAAITLLYQ